MSGFTEADVHDQCGRTMIVTGSNTGIGFEIARVLAQRGGKLTRRSRRPRAGGDLMRRGPQAAAHNLRVARNLLRPTPARGHRKYFTLPSPPRHTTTC